LGCIREFLKLVILDVMYNCREKEKLYEERINRPKKNKSHGDGDGGSALWADEERQRRYQVKYPAGEESSKRKIERKEEESRRHSNKTEEYEFEVVVV